MPPKMPKNTCPLLNDIINRIKDLSYHCEEEYNSHWDVKHLIDLVEEVRSANSALRENAEYYMEKAEDLSDKVDTLEDTNRDLTRQVSQLEKELEKAEELISKLHWQQSADRANLSGGWL